MNVIFVESLEAYMLLIPEEIQPYLLFVIGAFCGVIWTGLSNGFRYLKQPTKRKRVPRQCYSTICRSRGTKKGEKFSCYSPTCSNNKNVTSRTKLKRLFNSALHFNMTF